MKKIVLLTSLVLAVIFLSVIYSDATERNVTIFFEYASSTKTAFIVECNNKIVYTFIDDTGIRKITFVMKDIATKKLEFVLTATTSDGVYRSEPYTKYVLGSSLNPPEGFQLENKKIKITKITL